MMFSSIPGRITGFAAGLLAANENQAELVRNFEQAELVRRSYKVFQLNVGCHRDSWSGTMTES